MVSQIVDTTAVILVTLLRCHFAGERRRTHLATADGVYRIGLRVQIGRSGAGHWPNLSGGALSQALAGADGKSRGDGVAA